MSYIIPFGDSSCNVVVPSRYMNVNCDRAVYAGGGPLPQDVMDATPMSVTINAIYFGKLTSRRKGLAGSSNGINGVGVFIGGLGGTDDIDYIVFNRIADANFFQNLPTGRGYLSAASDGIDNHVLVFGGRIRLIETSETDLVNLTSAVVTPNILELQVSVQKHSSTSNDLHDVAVVVGGRSSNLAVDYIQRTNFNSLVSAFECGNLLYDIQDLASTSNGILDKFFVVSGWDGMYSSYGDVIQVLSFTGPAIAANLYGHITQARISITATSNAHLGRGITAGGYGIKLIDYFSTISYTEANIFGDLTVGRWELASASNCSATYQDLTCQCVYGLKTDSTDPVYIDVVHEYLLLLDTNNILHIYDKRNLSYVGRLTNVCRYHYDDQYLYVLFDIDGFTLALYNLSDMSFYKSISYNASASRDNSLLIVGKYYILVQRGTKLYVFDTRSLRLLACYSCQSLNFRSATSVGSLYVAAHQDGIVIYDLDTLIQRVVTCDPAPNIRTNSTDLQVILSSQIVYGLVFDLMSLDSDVNKMNFITRIYSDNIVSQNKYLIESPSIIEPININNSTNIIYYNYPEEDIIYFFTKVRFYTIDILDQDLLDLNVVVYPYVHFYGYCSFNRLSTEFGYYPFIPGSYAFIINKVSRNVNPLIYKDVSVTTTDNTLSPILPGDKVEDNVIEVEFLDPVHVSFNVGLDACRGNDYVFFPTDVLSGGLFIPVYSDLPLTLLNVYKYVNNVSIPTTLNLTQPRFDYSATSDRMWRVCIFGGKSSLLVLSTVEMFPLVGAFDDLIIYGELERAVYSTDACSNTTGQLAMISSGQENDTTFYNATQLFNMSSTSYASHFADLSVEGSGLPDIISNGSIGDVVLRQGNQLQLLHFNIPAFANLWIDNADYILSDKTDHYFSVSFGEYDYATNGWRSFKVSNPYLFCSHNLTNYYGHYNTQIRQKCDTTSTKLILSWDEYGQPFTYQVYFNVDKSLSIGIGIRSYQYTAGPLYPVHLSQTFNGHYILGPSLIYNYYTYFKPYTSPTFHFLQPVHSITYYRDTLQTCYKMSEGYFYDDKTILCNYTQVFDRYDFISYAKVYDYFSKRRYTLLQYLVDDEKVTWSPITDKNKILFKFTSLQQYLFDNDYFKPYTLSVSPTKLRDGFSLDQSSIPTSHTTTLYTLETYHDTLVRTLRVPYIHAVSSNFSHGYNTYYFYANERFYALKDASNYSRMILLDQNLRETPDLFRAYFVANNYYVIRGSFTRLNFSSSIEYLGTIDIGQRTTFNFAFGSSVEISILEQGRYLLYVYNNFAKVFRIHDDDTLSPIVSYNMSSSLSYIETDEAVYYYLRKNPFRSDQIYYYGIRYGERYLPYYDLYRPLIKVQPIEGDDTLYYYDIISNSVIVYGNPGDIAAIYVTKSHCYDQRFVANITPGLEIKFYRNICNCDLYNNDKYYFTNFIDDSTISISGEYDVDDNCLTVTSSRLSIEINPLLMQFVLDNIYFESGEVLLEIYDKDGNKIIDIGQVYEGDIYRNVILYFSAGHFIENKIRIETDKTLRTTSLHLLSSDDVNKFQYTYHFLPFDTLDNIVLYSNKNISTSYSHLSFIECYNPNRYLTYVNSNVENRDSTSRQISTLQDYDLYSVINYYYSSLRDITFVDNRPGWRSFVGTVGWINTYSDISQYKGVGKRPYLFIIPDNDPSYYKVLFDPYGEKYYKFKAEGGFKVRLILPNGAKLYNFFIKRYFSDSGVVVRDSDFLMVSSMYYDSGVIYYYRINVIIGKDGVACVSLPPGIPVRCTILERYLYPYYPKASLYQSVEKSKFTESEVEIESFPRIYINRGRFKVKRINNAVIKDSVKIPPERSICVRVFDDSVIIPSFYGYQHGPVEISSSGIKSILYYYYDYPYRWSWGYKNVTSMPFNIEDIDCVHFRLFRLKDGRCYYLNGYNFEYLGNDVRLLGCYGYHIIEGSSCGHSLVCLIYVFEDSSYLERYHRYHDCYDDQITYYYNGPHSTYSLIAVTDYYPYSLRRFNISNVIAISRAANRILQFDGTNYYYYYRTYTYGITYDKYLIPGEIMSQFSEYTYFAHSLVADNVYYVNIQPGKNRISFSRFNVLNGQPFKFCITAHSGASSNPVLFFKHPNLLRFFCVTVSNIVYDDYHRIFYYNDEWYSLYKIIYECNFEYLGQVSISSDRIDSPPYGSFPGVDDYISVPRGYRCTTYNFRVSDPYYRRCS